MPILGRNTDSLLSQINRRPHSTRADHENADTGYSPKEQNASDIEREPESDESEEESRRKTDDSDDEPSPKRAKRDTHRYRLGSLTSSANNSNIGNSRSNGIKFPSAADEVWFKGPKHHKKQKKFSGTSSKPKVVPQKQGIKDEKKITDSKKSLKKLPSQSVTSSANAPQGTYPTEFVLADRRLD
jgi:hypothetical protein